MAWFALRYNFIWEQVGFYERGCRSQMLQRVDWLLACQPPPHEGTWLWHQEGLSVQESLQWQGAQVKT